ncbi:6859_t:CDS:2 [Paraglomus brasilianum]|uniref:6859_t:CDS:1 n=1 Tax=Paraglomus brasilianum TaxID=144538 RepID=A0A9N9CS38_9GLOM|nr:6859_t:CDS:2 [Paraglomus brasilianum]
MQEYLSFFGWLFLPPLATSFVQRTYYGIVYSNNAPHPQSPKFRKHYKRIYTIVVISYLVYTIFAAIESIQPNFYEILGVKKEFEAKTLKTHFRRLQLQYHPDKNPDAEAQATFILIRRAYDTLMDPVQRFAYDRFGPEIIKCDYCKTTRDFLSNGWAEFGAFYTGTGLLLLIFNFLGKGQFGRFWRFVAFFGVACMEASMILHPKSTAESFMSVFLRNMPVFEQILVLRRLCVAIFLALSHVGPIWFPSEVADIRQDLQRLELISKSALQEASDLLVDGFEPFRKDNTAQKMLKRKMEMYEVNARLNSYSEFKNMYNDVRQRLMTNKRKN